MYRAVIFYFSGTGNTWWVADKIEKQLDARNINADIVSIDTVDAKKADWWIKTADLVLFGWPVYGSDLPKPMKQFIDRLMVVEKGKHVHTFCTQMMCSGDGAWLYHKHFEKKGLIIDSAEHFNMPANINLLGGIRVNPRNDKKIKKIMAKCEMQIGQYVEMLMMGKARIKGKHSYLLGILQRAPYRIMFRRWQNMPELDEARCTGCGLCASLCPVENIKMDMVPEFLGHCAQCRRCFAFCPTSAVTVKGRSFNLKKKRTPYSVHDKRFKPSMLK